jgi:hypothetical protein
MKTTGKAKPPANTIALLLGTRVDHEYLVMTATAVRYSDRKGLHGIGDHDDEFDDSNELHNLGGCEFRDLESRCQNSADYAREGRGAYAFSTEYRNAYNVNRDRAKKMFKALDRLEHSMKAFYERLGRVDTFDAYLLRVASALRISTFVLCDREPRNFGGGEWHAIDAVAAAAWVRKQEADYLARYAPPTLVDVPAIAMQLATAV